MEKRIVTYRGNNVPSLSDPDHLFSLIAYEYVGETFEVDRSKARTFRDKMDSKLNGMGKGNFIRARLNIDTGEIFEL